MTVGNTTSEAFRIAFGDRSTPAKKDDKPKAVFWLNVGYESDVKDEDGTNRFVSLPFGIPLDTQEALATNGKNREFAAFQQARNDLLEQIMECAQQLQAGESRLINLQVQIRKVNDEAEAISADQNPFSRKLTL